MNAYESQTVWRTGDLVVVEDGTSFHVLSIDGLLRASHEAGAFSLEDDLYRWTFTLTDGVLEKRSTVERFDEGERPTSTEIVLRDLNRVDGPRSAHWVEVLRAALELRGAAEARAQETEAAASARRRAAFLGALPPDATELEFRYTDRGWAVGVPGQAEFWVDSTWRYRGKDLHYALRDILRLNGAPITSFVARLEGDQEWMMYGDD